ncbi:MAG: hypothetical protein KDD53_01660 [Bdellovibrionales bacterium]|nr:hypothetical protein [Bdellovibrionales bacterium]
MPTVVYTTPATLVRIVLGVVTAVMLYRNLPEVARIAACSLWDSFRVLIRRRNRIQSPFLQIGSDLPATATTARTLGGLGSRSVLAEGRPEQAGGKDLCMGFPPA